MKKMSEYFAELRQAIDVNKGYDVEKIEKAYLDGRYGGVPVFDSIFFPNDDIE